MIQQASRIRFPINCRLVERHTGKAVRGQISPTSKKDLVGWTQWRYRAEDEDRTWDWWGIFLQSQRSANRYECYSLIAADRKITRGQRDLHTGTGLGETIA